MKKNALLVVHTNTWFTEMIRVALALKKSGEIDPFFHFPYNYPTLRMDQKRLTLSGIPFSEATSGASHNPNFVLRIAENLLGRVVHISRLRYIDLVLSRLSPLFASIHFFLSNLRDIRFYKNLIADQNISIVVMAGDLVGYNTPEIARAAQDSGVACVIVPSTMSDGTEQAEAYFFNPNFSMSQPFNKLAGKIWPKWTKFHKGKWLVRVPAEQIFSRHILKSDPPLPWISSSSRADRIAVESQAMYDYYIKCGISADKLRLTGSIANDYLAAINNDRENKKNELYRTLGLDSTKKLILTALPPDSLYMTGGRPECEFGTYRELTVYWINTLVRGNTHNVVISLHPSVGKAEFEYLESAGVRISELPIVDLIPLCDVFVASVSSTIRWAIACAKPVINYDVYFYRYTDFSEVKGVIYINKKEDYSRIISTLDQDPKFLETLNVKIRSEAKRWGNLDGRESRRILALFEEEIKNKSLRN